jgi:hypothetical protein
MFDAGVRWLGVSVETAGVEEGMRVDADRRRGSMLVLPAAYAWLAAVLLGAILLDATWAAGAGEAGGEAGDLLLGITGLTIVAGIGAVAASWTERAPWLFLVSLLLVVGELLAPALFSQLVPDAQSATGVRIGPWIRLGGIWSASVLALLGLRESWRRS